MKHSLTLLGLALLFTVPPLSAQDQQNPMRQAASESAVAALLQDNPQAKYFCFTENRTHEIQSPSILPSRWAERSSARRLLFDETCAPGEFYTWQIGLYAPWETVQDVRMTFSDLTGADGKTIPASALRCFPLGGMDSRGKPFTKRVDVEKGKVQAFWIGIDVAEDCLGTYQGQVSVAPQGLPVTELAVRLTVEGDPVPHHGDDEGFRKSRLRWLDSTAGAAETPTAPYIPITLDGQTIHTLGGTVELADSGLPRQITTCYDQSLQRDKTVSNPVLSGEVAFLIETGQGIEKLDPAGLEITRSSASDVLWQARRQSENFDVLCEGEMEFDGFAEYRISVTAKKDVTVKDIRLEVPYTEYASKYLMGLGRKGGLLPALPVNWKWDINKHQDKLWMGNVNAGWNIKWKDENYVRPLVNVYYNLGKIKEPVSWGNHGKGGVTVSQVSGRTVQVQAYSGERSLTKGTTLHFDMETLITPVKPYNLAALSQNRIYHGASAETSKDLSQAKTAGANYITIHHARDIYPYINYPYSDASSPDLKKFIEEAHRENLGVRVYYTTRELTVKIPELWALKSLGGEVIFDGPGKDSRTLLHPGGPHPWLLENLVDHFIPAWHTQIHAGKFQGETDLSVLTTPDSRWNNFYLGGLDWMVNRIGLDGVYIDDSALDRKTLQRGRRILDADGKRRLIDIHSWNHMNGHAGFVSSVHIYLELLPYTDRTWFGEGFGDENSLDFWMVEMSGIPFGLTSEMLDARNPFRGMVYGMLPRAGWNNDPVPLWKLWEEFGMKDARIRGYWDERCPVKTGEESLPATVYLNGDKALVVVANWTNQPKKGKLTINEKGLGFTPSHVSLPQIERVQSGKSFDSSEPFEIMERGGLILLMEK
ncbi:MAG: DUF6067 family protein [Planctomycetaceae bacterium]|jgi:hypothetical protein|nr:DUF6067 family protein [Planctomycetaceae bacterium]